MPSIKNNSVIQGTTESSSDSSGSVIVSGGVGIAKDVHIGGTLNSATIKGNIDIESDKTITLSGSLDTTAGTLAHII